MALPAGPGNVVMAAAVRRLHHPKHVYPTGSKERHLFALGP